MTSDTKRRRRKKLFILLGAALCCGLATYMGLASISGEEHQPAQTPFTIPTVIPTLTLTGTPLTPTATPENVPSLSDTQWSREMMVCIDEKSIAGAMSTLSMAMSSEPFDAIGFCASVSAFKAAVTADQACWDAVCLPEHPLLWESHILHSQALETYNVAAILLLDFCATGEIECMNLAYIAVADGNLLMNQATNALELYHQKER